MGHIKETYDSLAEYGDGKIPDHMLAKGCTDPCLNIVNEILAGRLV